MVTKANSKNIITRFFVLILLSAILFLIIKYGIILNKEENSVWPLYVVVVLMSSVYLGLLISLFGVIGVQIDIPSNEIEFMRLFFKQSISKSEIAQYYKSVYNTKSGTTYGLILVLRDSKLIELNPANLTDVMAIEEYLKNLATEFMGERKSSYPFTSAL